MKNNFIVIKNHNSLHKIRINHIEWIKVFGDCITIILDNNKRIGASRTLKSIKSELPDEFVPINRNMLVNTEKVVELKTNERVVILDNKEVLPVSVRRLKKLKEHLTCNF
jgi:DNA-binding LytR/AlgR family response regulator